MIGQWVWCTNSLNPVTLLTNSCDHSKHSRVSCFDGNMVVWPHFVLSGTNSRYLLDIHTIYEISLGYLKFESLYYRPQIAIPREDHKRGMFWAERFCWGPRIPQLRNEKIIWDDLFPGHNVLKPSSQGSPSTEEENCGHVCFYKHACKGLHPRICSYYFTTELMLQFLPNGQFSGVTEIFGRLYWIFH